MRIFQVKNDAITFVFFRTDENVADKFAWLASSQLYPFFAIECGFVVLLPQTLPELTAIHVV